MLTNQGVWRLSTLSRGAASLCASRLLQLQQSRQFYSTSQHERHKSTTLHGKKYHEQYIHALENPEEFWGRAADDLMWDKRWTSVYKDTTDPNIFPKDFPEHAKHHAFPSWFHGGKINMCYNAVDRHVESGHGDQVALVFDSPGINVKKTVTYKELQQMVAKFAGNCFVIIGIKWLVRQLIVFRNVAT